MDRRVQIPTQLRNHGHDCFLLKNVKAEALPTDSQHSPQVCAWSLCHTFPGNKRLMQTNLQQYLSSGAEDYGKVGMTQTLPTEMSCTLRAPLAKETF